MLLTDKIIIKVNPSNLKRLREFLPNIKSYEVIEIPVLYLSEQSHIKVDVICDICNIQKSIPYKSYIKSIKNGGYYACSQKCSKTKSINTNIKKYGFENPSKSEVIKNKIKKTFQEKYGVDNISQLPNIIEKIKIGVYKSYIENIDSIKEKQKLTNIKRYGVQDVNKEKWFKEKIKELNFEKYGVTNASKLPSVKDKIKQTCNYKYNCNSPFEYEEIKDKIKETNLRKYGFEYISQNTDIYEKKILSGFRIKKHDCGLTYQGTYEKDFIDMCLIKNIIISKPPSFIYEMNGKSKRYYPDFYIEKYNTIIEVKSSYYYNLHKEKNILKKEIIISNGFNYLMILDKNYEEFLLLFKIYN